MLALSTDEKALLASITDTETTVVVLVDSPDDTTTVYPGCRGKTSPAWLISRLASSLDDAKITWKLDEYRMPLYRLGWSNENPRLAVWLNAGFPAIQIATRSFPVECIRDLLSVVSGHSGKDSDSHFLMLSSHFNYAILSETIMVILMIVASAVILFFIFIFSFLFGKKSDQHLHDFFTVLWLPFIYFMVNLVSLMLAQSAVTSLVGMRFGNSGAWSIIPLVAFAAKAGLAWFFITLVLALNQLIKFPDDSFIYGYIASIICLVNVFVFASLDFSLSIQFLAVYLLSIFVYRFKHPFAQVIGIVVLVLPFIPYAIALASGNAGQVSGKLEPLFHGENFWNARLALFVMPTQLLVARFEHTLGIFGQRTKFYLPVNLFAVMVISAVSVGALLLIPAYTRERPLVATITQTIYGTEAEIKTSTPIEFPDLELEEIPSLASRPTLDRDSAILIPVTTTSRQYLERQLVNLRIKSALSYDQIELEISSDGFIPVLDASESFELRNAGATALFTHEDSGSDAVSDDWFISFSAPSDANLLANVRMVSRENPWGLSAVNENVQTDYKLEVISIVPLSGLAQ